ncbi:hypothetical protein [Dysgonomonas sp. GY617]|uniref:hypothetical protein n=1 Tax=Dysgonomonas sp. GY617 TaxID=2780420 RepID=UPI0018834588|nr:hypothetical protein [Dysgonomonas sp. GY617]MBF0576591.1 hypothetical protein [Dysgonomonas sp. GY617]
MNKNYYNISFSRLALLLLPMRWRKNAIVALMSSLVRPLAVLHSRFINYTNSLDTDVLCQVCYLEGRLNDLYDYYDRRIFIRDTPINFDDFILHKEITGKPILLSKEGTGDPYILVRNNMLGTTITDFDVVFPYGYNFSDDELKKLRSIINSNKLASKKYRIVYE